MNICYLNLKNEILVDRNIKDALSSCPGRSIILLEDIEYLL